ncbi:MAG: hypothetical protein LAO20_02285 [Acidobacteriia bacterium]|nr:hypothetical protein [Terriglobia bacterium]
MKRAGIISTGIFLLFFATAALGYGQGDQKGKGQGKSQGQQHQKAQPAQHQQPAQAHQQPAQTRQRPEQQRQPQASRPAQRETRPGQAYGGAYYGGVRPNGPAYGGVHHSGIPQQQKQVRSGFGQSRARAWNDDHRSWGQRGGYNGYRIPEARFRSYWGRDHFFRIYGLPMIFVGGYPRFRYDGYWVTFVDPWPEMWPDTWYETDDVYLDYTDDGYYLYNRSRPGVGIAVTIAF